MKFDDGIFGLYSWLLRHHRSLSCAMIGPMPTLTYISIGFLDDSIYAEDCFGVDHNMLLIRRSLTTSNVSALEPITAFCGPHAIPSAPPEDWQESECPRYAFGV
jgi:hypothetical protein